MKTNYLTEEDLIELGWEKINAKIFKKSLSSTSNDYFFIRLIIGYLNNEILTFSISIYNSFGERLFYGDCPDKKTFLLIQKLINIK